MRKGQSLESDRCVFSPGYTRPGALRGKLFLLSVSYFSHLQNATYLICLGENSVSAYKFLEGRKWILVPLFFSGPLPPVTDPSGIFRCLEGRRCPCCMVRCILNLELCNYKWVFTGTGILLLKKERPWLTQLPAAFSLIRALVFCISRLNHCQTFITKKNEIKYTCKTN